MSRVYEGQRTEDDVRVTVNGRKLNPRNDLCNHSPDGFEWGYGGSGPAQLALAILVDHLKHKPEDIGLLRKIVRWADDTDVKCVTEYWAERGHQLFKGRIAGLQQGSWTMNTEDVTATLRWLIDPKASARSW